MAFSYKNPLETAINSLPSNFAGQALSSTSESIISRLDFLNDHFAFGLKKEVEESLIQRGIELAPMGFKVHSHPACKTIENHLILRVVPLLFNKIPSIAFISMREEKVEKFLKVRNFSRYGVIKAMKPLNAFLDSKDNFRYLEVDGMHSSHDQMVNRFRDECLSNGWFPKAVFIHDELHFWKPQELANFFDRIPEIKQLVGTVVCPPELLLGEASSKNPRIYTYELIDGTFSFFPDGVASEGYTQPVETTTWWFKTSYVQSDSSFLRISVIHSLFAHHLVTIDRGSMLQKRIFLEKPMCLLDKELTSMSSELSGGLIERSTMLSILTYLSCLKSPNCESALAKLRQLEKRDLFPDEAFLVSSISGTFIKYGIGKSLDKDIIEKLEEKIFSLLPSFLQDYVDRKKKWNGIFRDFMKEISVKHFSLPRHGFVVKKDGLFDEPMPYLSDRKSSSYSFGRRLPFRTFLQFTNLKMLDFGFPKSIKVDVLRLVDKRSEPCSLESSSNVPLLLLTDHQFNGEPIENNSVNDNFSSSGIVIQKEMVVPTFEKSSIDYGSRKNCCVFDSFAHFSDLSAEVLLDLVFNSDISEHLFDAIENDLPLTLDMIQEVAIALDFRATIEMSGVQRRFNLNGRNDAFICLSKGHAEPISKRQISDLLNQGGLSSPSSSCKVLEQIVGKNVGSFFIEKERAFKLLSSLKKGCTGIMLESNPDGAKSLSALSDSMDSVGHLLSKVPFDLSVTLGVPGCGKSHAVKSFLTRNPMFQTLVVSPRRALAEDWSDSVKGTLHRVKTFESALLDFFPAVKLLVIDEITLYPPGFIDLLCLVHFLRVNKIWIGNFFQKRRFEDLILNGTFETFHVIALGDALQTQYYSSTDSHLLSRKHDLVRILEVIKGPLDYLWYSFRAPKGLNNLIDFQCLGSKEYEDFKIFSEVSVVKSFNYSAFLVASQEDKRNSCLSIPVMTFGESQGLTFEKKILIMLSNDTLASSEQSIIVAITRSKVGFDFVFASGRTLEEFKMCSKKKMLGYILAKKKVDKERLVNLIPHCNVNLIMGSGNLEEKASNDPFILPEIQPDYIMADEVAPDSFQFGPVWLKTHLPIVSINPLLAETFEKMQAKEKREFWHISRGFSEQFPDTDKGLVEDVMGLGFRFDSIFPRHNGADDTTFWEGVKKRLRFSDPRKERERLEESRKYAPQMLELFLNTLPVNFEVVRGDLEKGLNSFNAKRAEKPNALWLAHSERSDIDWPLNRIFLFMKSQLCTKQEKMFTTAKAGQTLACFHHTILFRFGPVLRAIEGAFMRACGESFYVHSGKNFSSLNEFVLKNEELFQGRSIESDYEAFDSSQDSMILAFEEALLKKIGMSQGFIDDYISLKLNLGCRLGSFAIMRFTGEFCTFLFNTFANMLFTFIKYDVNHRRDRILFAGDDMASIGALRERKDSFSKLINLFSLKAKEDVRKIPSFCGWFLTPDGILKSPKLLWARISLMKQRGLINSCLDNYFLEAVFAYNLGEKLFEYFDEEQLEYHYSVSRFFVENKYKFSGEAKISFYGSVSTFGNKCQSLKSMISPSKLTNQISKLTPLKVQKSMVTLLSYLLKFFNRFEGSNRISKLVMLVKKRWQFLISNFLMRLNCSTSKEKLKAILICILGRFLYVSRRSYQTLGVSKAASCFMTTLQIRSRQALLLPITSTLKRVRPSLSSGQSIFSLRLIHTWLKLLKLPWNYMTSISNVVGRFSGLMLGAFIGCLIRLGIFARAMVTAVGLNRRFGAVLSSNTQKSWNQIFVINWEMLRFQKKVLTQRSLAEVFSCQLERPEEKGSLLMLRNLKKGIILSCLGQRRLVLIERTRRLREMATVQDVVQSTVRAAVDQWLWDHYIDTNHQILEENASLLDIPAGRAPAARAVLNHFTKYLFGNVAILGSSAKTAWPNVTINLPPLTTTAVAGGNVTKNYTMNLSRIIPALETFRSIHEEAVIRNCTFRQLCECYATPAAGFLKDQWTNGNSTNIYKKWPRALESAPWVAFDFCSGLRMNDLTPDEKKVVDRLTKRLFRTEGQKGIFEAGQEVNVDLEG